MTNTHDNSVAQQDRDDILCRVGSFMDDFPNLQERVWFIGLLRDLGSLSDSEALDLIIAAASN